MVYDTKRGRIVRFGGMNHKVGLLGDTWEWDGKHWVERADMGPAPRFGHSMAYDEKRNRVILFL